jgi:hypothetical protein
MAANPTLQQELRELWYAARTSTDQNCDDDLASELAELLRARGWYCAEDAADLKELALMTCDDLRETDEGEYRRSMA